MPDGPPSFRPDDLLAVLERHGVEHVVIGGLAAALHGAAYVTFDVDITPATTPGNLERLSTALREVDARIRVEGIPEGLPFDDDAAPLGRSAMWNLTTTYGDVDISFVPAGTGGYDDLSKAAVTVTIHGVAVSVASLEDVIRSKAAANREKDRLVLPMLRRLLDHSRRQAGSPDPGN